jgi:hypothetical protein
MELALLGVINASANGISPPSRKYEVTDKNIEKLITMLESPEASIRYEACEDLRVSPVLTSKAVNALVHTLNDPDADVADAAQRALAFHAPKLEPDTAKSEVQKETIEEPRSNPNWTMIRVGIGTLVSILVTTAAGIFFESGCTISNYMGNLFFIFVVTWISWIVISSRFRGIGSSNLAGMFLSLLVILLGAFPCIASIGFWIAPVCN